MLYPQSAQGHAAEFNHRCWLAVVQLYVLLLSQGLESAATMLLTILRLLCWLCAVQVADWQWRQQARELCRSYHPTMRHTHLCHTHRQQLL
jgi:hypothetical protein